MLKLELIDEERKVVFDVVEKLFEDFVLVDDFVVEKVWDEIL